MGTSRLETRAALSLKFVTNCIPVCPPKLLETSRRESIHGKFFFLMLKLEQVRVGFETGHLGL